MHRLGRWLLSLRWLLAFGGLVGLLSGGSVGCDGGCVGLAESYKLSGCLGDDQCKTLQTDCQIRLECQSAFQYCQGFMVGRELNMRCAAPDGHSFQTIIGVRDTYLQATFVLADGKVCQGKFE